MITLLQRCFLNCTTKPERERERENEKRSRRASGRRQQGGNENVGGSGLLERRKRKTGVQDFSTDVETSPVSVEGKRKFVRKQVGLSATCVQLSPLVSLFKRLIKTSRPCSRLSFTAVIFEIWESAAF